MCARTLKALLVAAVLCATWSCDGSTNGPGENGLPLTEGSYSVSLMGFDLSTDPRIQVCSPIGVPSTGKNMQTIVDLRRESSVWVGRSAAGAGDFVIRLESGGAGTGSSAAVQGSASGTALWADPRFPARDLRVQFQGTGTVAATLTASASFVNGQINGTIVFSDSNGAASTCPMVLLTMQPVR